MFPTHQDTLERFVGQRVETVFSSRTDAAVHATDNAFHVDLDRRDRHGNPVVRLPFPDTGRTPVLTLPAPLHAPRAVQEAHPPVTVMKALNAFLRRERIRVTEAYEVPSTFSARYPQKDLGEDRKENRKEDLNEDRKEDRKKDRTKTGAG